MNLFVTLKTKILLLVNWFLKVSLIKKGIVVVGIILIVWFLYTRIFAANNAALQYETAQVEKGTIISTLTESGNVSSDSQTNVTSPTNGIVTDVYVKNGDIVMAGQNLFSVKSTATPQEKEQAYADYLSSQNSLLSSQQSKQALQAQLEQSRASVITASSNQTTMQNNLNVSQLNPSTHQPYTQNDIDLINSALTSSRESFTATETKYNQADNSIAAANASFQVTSLKYQATQDSTVTAPTDGKVANLSITTGSAVSASTTTTTTTGSGSSSSSSSSSAGGSSVLVLGDFSSLFIKTPVSEIDVATIKAGEKATITLDALPDKTFVGTVASIDTIGSNTSGVVTFNAYIRFIDPPTTIQPAMTASAVIQTARKDDVLYVPTTAIQTATDGTSYVRVQKDGGISEVDVTTGIASDTDTEITSGLSEGDTVVTSIITQATTTGSQTTSPFSSTRNAGFGGGFGGSGAARTLRTSGGAGGR